MTSRPSAHRGRPSRPDYARPGGPWDIGPLNELASPALVDGALRLTSPQVGQRAAALATALTERGVQQGDVVAFQLPNWWEAIVCYHACWRLGVIAFPLHHRVRGEARHDLLVRTEPAVALVAATLDPPDGALVIRGSRPALPGLAVDSQPSDADAVPPATIDPAEPAVLLATSGSTGRPKLVRHTHRGLHGKARVMVEAHGLRPDDVVLMPAPLAHISGLLNGVLLPGQAGMTTVLMDRWDPAAALPIIERERVSFMIGPPTFFVDLAAEPGCTGRAVQSLRLISCGGATVTPAFVADCTRRLGATVKRTYGSTEAPTVTTAHVGDDPAKARLTDGRTVGDVELLVIDPQTGVPVGPGQTGDLLVRGPEVCDGYTDPQATAEAFDADGFFRTGDLARIDAEGWLTIVGRAASTIIRGGENISPAAVEAACATLDDVGHVAVVGFPDERLGQRVALVVEGDAPPALEAVQDACRHAGLPRFAWPERLLAVDKIPRLAAGKADRRALEELVARGRNM